MKIMIGAPYIKGTRLCSNIEGINDPFTLWYEVKKEYKKYLCTERADGFLIGILPYAMARSSDNDPLTIVCQAPVSEQLYYQLCTHYIPTLAKCIEWYHNIRIECELDHTKLNSFNAVGTGVSGGVDSYYTMLKSKQGNPPGYQITHGVYFEFDPKGNFDGEISGKMRELSEIICSEYGIEFIDIKSNICEKVFYVAHGAIITPMFLSYVFALQKLFAKYYFSSGRTYDSFKIVLHASSLYDLLNMHLLSTENIDLYSTGSEAIRHEKTNYIADFDLPRKYFMVCLSPKVEKGILKNCSRCSKCTRTMIHLDLVDKLDYFNDIFDVEAYRKDRDYYWGYLSFKGKKDQYVAETLNLFKKQKRHFPLSARIAGFRKWVKNGFKRGNPLQYDYRP